MHAILTNLQALAKALGGEVSGGQVLAPGPGHSAIDRSLSVKLDGGAPDGFITHSFAGDDPIACRDHVRAKVGLAPFKPNGAGRRRASDDAIERALMAAVTKQDGQKPKGRVVAGYDYTDQNGTLLYQVLRLEPKSFRQRRPDGNTGWIWHLGERRVVYRLPELLKYPDATVFLCEGEKDADRVASLGHCATTVAGGKWTNECVQALAARDVSILQDNDEPGRKKALAAAQALHGSAKTIRIVSLPDLPDKGDVSDWLDVDPRRAEKLADICFDAAEWIPDAATAARTGCVADHGVEPPGATSRSALDAGEKGPHTLADSSENPSTELPGDNARGDEGRCARSQADILIELSRSAQLFHTADGRGFADLEINGHRETWPIRSKSFRHWLARGFFEMTEGAPNSDAMQSALNVIEAKAHFDSPERVVHLRVGGLDGRIYLNLADESWKAVAIDTTGWRVVDNPPVRFRRAAGMLALPAPATGGSVESLRSFLNVKTDADFVLVVAWLLACLRDRGPYPVLVLSGEQGSAKSTFSAFLRALVDPNTAPLRALPREDRDLFIAANNGHVLCFDNVSGLPAWISDTLCRLAIGGGFAVRQLYSDQDEVLFDATRPVILNGIEDIVARPDLADRAIFLTLEAISEERRRPEEALWAEFKARRPFILAALLDAMVEGLKRLPETHLSKLPRMADFALWASACEPVLWPTGTFWSAYCGNRDDAVEGVIEADPVATAVRAFMADRSVWAGTASDLLGSLSGAADERTTKAKTWPENPRALAGRLRRAATFLRKIGIEISFDRQGRRRTRIIKITATPSEPRAEEGGAQPSAPSASSAENPKSMSCNGLAAHGLRTVASDADGMDQELGDTVRTNPLKSKGGTAADGADANFPIQSVPETIPGASGENHSSINVCDGVTALKSVPWEAEL
jgi:hypothetical protein